eukprot:scaffold114153_cov69-Phaeocystis_antarctica.AAC.2
MRALPFASVPCVQAKLACRNYPPRKAAPARVHAPAALTAPVASTATTSLGACGVPKTSMPSTACGATARGARAGGGGSGSISGGGSGGNIGLRLLRCCGNMACASSTAAAR